MLNWKKVIRLLSMAKKAEIFESKLSQDDLNTLAYIVKMDIDKEVNARLDKKAYTINQALETSMAAALFEYTDLSIEEAERIFERSNEYMKDSEEFLLKYREEWIMKINEIKPKIKEECLKLLELDKSQAEAIKILGEKFKDVPQKDRVNIYKETKEEWCKSCHAIEKGNEAELEEKEVSNVNTPKEENKGNTKTIDKSDNTFEVVDKKIVFNGKYSEYMKVNNGLKVGSVFFKSLGEIEEYKKKELEELQKQIEHFNCEVEEIKAAFSFEG